LPFVKIVCTSCKPSESLSQMSKRETPSEMASAHRI
jgi:hypothetical protein